MVLIKVDQTKIKVELVNKLLLILHAFRYIKSKFNIYQIKI